MRRILRQGRRCRVGQEADRARPDPRRDAGEGAAGRARSSRTYGAAEGPGQGRAEGVAGGMTFPTDLEGREAQRDELIRTAEERARRQVLRWSRSPYCSGLYL